MKPKTALSWSMISLYHQCPFKWYKQYIQKVYQPSNINFIFGIAYHKIMEMMFRAGNFVYEDLEVKWYDVFLNMISKHQWRCTSKIPKSQIEYFMNHGKRLINTSLNLLRDNKLLRQAPNDCLEKRMNVKFRDFKLTTKPDIMIPNENGLTLLDYKTSQKAKEEHQIQVMIYKEVAACKGYNVTKVGLLYPALNRLDFVNYPRKKAAEYINNAYQGILKNEFEPKENEYCKTCHLRMKYKCSIKSYRPRKIKSKKPKKIKYEL